MMVAANIYDIINLNEESFCRLFFAFTHVFGGRFAACASTDFLILYTEPGNRFFNLLQGDGAKTTIAITILTYTPYNLTLYIECEKNTCPVLFVACYVLSECAASA